MHSQIVKWVNNFLLLTFDFCSYGGESEETLRLRKNRFKSYDTHDTYDDFNNNDKTNSTNPNTQPTAPVRFYGEFGVSDQIKRRHCRYFFDSLWLYLLTLGLGTAERQLAFEEISIQFRDPRKY